MAPVVGDGLSRDVLARSYFMQKPQGRGPCVAIEVLSVPVLVTGHRWRRDGSWQRPSARRLRLQKRKRRSSDRCSRPVVVRRQRTECSTSLGWKARREGDLAWKRGRLPSPQRVRSVGRNFRSALCSALLLKKEGGRAGRLWQGGTYATIFGFRWQARPENVRQGASILVRGERPITFAVSGATPATKG